MSEAAPASSTPLSGVAFSLSAAAAGAPEAPAPSAQQPSADGVPPPVGPFRGDLPLPRHVVESDALFLDESPASAPGAGDTEPPHDGAQGNEDPAENPQETPAIDANPGATTAQLETHMVEAAGVDPTIARFYTGRLRQALFQPAPTREQLDTGRQETEAAMREQYGEHADRVAQAARREMMDMARGFPQLPELLERTGMGNDMGVIRAFAGRAYDKWRAASGLPPR